MTKAKITAKAKKPNLTARQRKAAQEKKDCEAYGAGCDAGYNLAMKWLRNKKLSIPTLGLDGLQHVVFEFMESHHKARGSKRSYVRGQIVGFFATLENPQQAQSFHEWKQKQGVQS